MNEPHLRLVTGNNSSSVSGTSSSRASLNKGRCQRPGISLRDIHMDTVDCRRPMTDERRVGPPKRATISPTVALFPLHMGTTDIKFPDTMQAQNIDMAGKPGLSQNVVMFPDTNRIDEKRDIKAAVMSRIENVREMMSETPTDFAKRMGLSYKDYWGAVERQSIDAAYIIKLSQSLNLSMDYLCCLVDDPEPLARAPQFPDFWARKAAAEARPAEKDETG